MYNLLLTSTLCCGLEKKDILVFDGGLPVIMGEYSRQLFKNGHQLTKK